MVIAAQFGQSHCGNVTSPARYSYSSQLLDCINKSNPSRSPPTTRTSKSGLRTNTNCTTPILQHVSAPPSAVSTRVAFFIHARQDNLWTSDCVHPVSTRAVHGVPLMQTVTTSSASFTRFWGMRLVLNSRPLARFPGNIEQCAHADDIDNT